MDFQSILDKYRIHADAATLLKKWEEPHRFYHNTTHLHDLLQQVEKDFKNGAFDEREKEKLALTAFFHDIIYNPARQDNEEKSAAFFMDLCADKNDRDIQDIYRAILDTKTHESNSPLSERFNKYDMNIVERDLDQLLQWEYGIYNEYKIFGNMVYKTGRLQFLEKLVRQYPHNKKNLEQLIAWVMMNY